jgi:cell division septation protein DedD
LGLAPAKATLAQMDEAMSPEDRRKAAAAMAGNKPAAKTAVAKPTPLKVVRTKPVSPPASTAATRPPPSGNWRIQLGAFSQRSSAEALFRKLSGNGALAGRSAAYLPSGKVIRLQVGPFQTRAAAANACRAVAARGQACFPVPAR